MLFLPLLFNFFLIFERKNIKHRGTLGKEVPILEKDKNIFSCWVSRTKEQF